MHPKVIYHKMSYTCLSQLCVEHQSTEVISKLGRKSAVLGKFIVKIDLVIAQIIMTQRFHIDKI